MANIKQINMGNKKIKITSYEAVGLAGGFIEGTEDRILEAWQYLQDTGLAYKLQGWFGRTAAVMVDQEIIKQKSNIIWQQEQ